MAIKDTTKHLRDLLSNISSDLEKAENGNKAASQRVRTGTVKLEKIAKLYRKESIKFDKSNKGPRKTAKKTSTKAKAKTTTTASASKAKVAAKPKAKAKAHKAKARAFSFRKPTAKLPRRHA